MSYLNTCIYSGTCIIIKVTVLVGHLSIITARLWVPNGCIVYISTCIKKAMNLFIAASLLQTGSTLCIQIMVVFRDTIKAQQTTNSGLY